MTAVTEPTLLSETDELRVQVNALTTEVTQLRTIRDNAAYITGPTECTEDRDCEEYGDNETGEDLPDVEWCSHIEHHHATWGDVHIREQLERLVVEILGLATNPAQDAVIDIREVIHNAIYSLLSSGENIHIEHDREPYKTILEQVEAEDRRTDLTYLVWSNQYRSWWRPDGAGYTYDIWDAGRYNAADATKTCNRRTWSADGPPPEVMVLAPEYGRDTFTVADIQALPDLMEQRINDATNTAITNRKD